VPPAPRWSGPGHQRPNGGDSGGRQAGGKAATPDPAKASKQARLRAIASIGGVYVEHRRRSVRSASRVCVERGRSMHGCLRWQGHAVRTVARTMAMLCCV
jgi:hypothetical protein